MKTVVFFLVIFMIVGAFTLRKKKVVMATKTSDFQEIGSLIFPSEKGAFETFFQDFLTNKSMFLDEHVDLIEEYGFDNPNALQITYMFGDSRELIGYVDWRGEENENEVEDFIKAQMSGKEVDWNHTKKLRESHAGEDQRDGSFIIDLFKAIDKDLMGAERQLLFFDLGFDAYVFSSVPKMTFAQVIEKAPNSFHGTDRLKK